MIMIWLLTTNPAMATAKPVNALSRETTTGMSAPPMGRTMRMPNAEAATATTTSSHRLGDATSQAAPPSAATAESTVSTREPANVMGAPEIQPCNLPAAMSEPEKVTAPIMTSRPTGIEKPAVTTPTPLRRANSTRATSAAAPPPTALKTETSCGIAVILTRRAPMRPATEPAAIPAMSAIEAHLRAEAAASLASRPTVSVPGAGLPT